MNGTLQLWCRSSMQPLNMTDQDGTREPEKGLGTDSNPEDVDTIRRHVKEITESNLFKRSVRSRRFLLFVVERAITGDVETLKERVIGRELFGRPAAYNTGEDSIVRVTASHVRQRLLHYYSIHGETSQIHLNLPPGSYVPEILRRTSNEVEWPDSPYDHSVLARHKTLASQQDSSSIARQTSVMSPPTMSFPPKTSFIRQIRGQWFVFCVLLLALSAVLWIRIRSDSTKHPSASTLPWSDLFGVSQSTTLVTSDPDIQEIESLAGNHLISVSDYANHRYCLESSRPTPELAEICRQVLIGNKSAAVDVPIVANISRLAQANSREIRVRVARQVQLSDLHGNSNLIFLGSPRSNPWVHLFNERLDFRFFTPQGVNGHDIIVNAHPREHELSSYVPTALHGITGQTFAIVAFVPGLDNMSQVLPYSTGYVQSAALTILDFYSRNRSLICAVNPLW